MVGIYCWSSAGDGYASGEAPYSGGLYANGLLAQDCAQEPERNELVCALNDVKGQVASGSSASTVHESELSFATYFL
jgi:hypothetical protein